MRKGLLIVTALALVLAVGTTAKADDRAEAIKRFEAGLDLMKTEDFAGAAVAFESSVRLFPTRSNLFNLANCYRALQRYGDSLEVIHRLETEFEGRLDEEMKLEVETLRQTLDNLVGSLEVKANLPGVTIRVGGREVGTTPLAKPLILGPGDHEVEALLDGYATRKRIVRVEPRWKAMVSFELHEETAADPGPEPEVTTEPAGPAAVEIGDELPPIRDAKLPPGGRGSLWTGGWVMAGLGAAVMIAGGVTGGLALAKGNELEADYPEGVPRSEKGEVDRMDSLAVTTNVLLGVGGAVVVAGVVLLILDDGPAERDVALLPAAGPSFAGAAIRGRF